MTETQDGLDLDEIEARAAAATPGPWWKKLMTIDWFRSHGHLTFADARFAHHAREDVSALVAEVERLRGQTCPHIEAGELLAIEHLRAEHDEAREEARQAREALQAVREIAIALNEQLPTVSAGAIIRLVDAVLSSGSQDA